MTAPVAATMPHGAQPGRTLPATWTGGRTRSGLNASGAASACAVALEASGGNDGPPEWEVGSVTSASR